MFAVPSSVEPIDDVHKLYHIAASTAIVFG